MSVNYDKHSVEKRHDKRFLGIFLMFVVVAVVVGLFAAMSISAISGYGIFDFLKSPTSAPAPAPTPVPTPVAAIDTGTGNLVTLGNVTNCTDTDGGVNPFLKGTCTGKNGVFVDTCNSTNSSLVIEYYCKKNGHCGSLLEDCTWFKNISTGLCINGMCQLKPQFAVEINALMLDIVSGAKVAEEGYTRDDVNLNPSTLGSSQVALSAMSQHRDDASFDKNVGGSGDCKCSKCLGQASACDNANGDFLQCQATSCQCETYPDECNCASRFLFWWVVVG